MINKFLRCYIEAIAEGMDVQLTKDEIKKLADNLENDEELFEFIDAKCIDCILEYTGGDCE